MKIEISVIKSLSNQSTDVWAHLSQGRRKVHVFHTGAANLIDKKGGVGDGRELDLTSFGKGDLHAINNL